VLYAQGAFDAVTTSVLTRVLDRARREGVPRIVVNCSEVTFADIAFLRALLSHSHDSRLVLDEVPLVVRRLLEATETTRLLPPESGPGET